MLAVKALYENGNIQWLEKPPLQKSEILVVFKSEAEQKKHVDKKTHAKDKSNLLDKYRGCIKNLDFDYEKEKVERLDEKYGSFN